MAERKLEELVHAAKRVPGERRVHAVVGDLEESVGGAGGPDAVDRPRRGRFVATKKAIEVYDRGFQLLDGGRPVALRPDEGRGDGGLVREERRVEDDAAGAGFSLFIEDQGRAQGNGGGVAVHWGGHTRDQTACGG